MVFAERFFFFFFPVYAKSEEACEARSVPVLFSSVRRRTCFSVRFYVAWVWFGLSRVGFVLIGFVSFFFSVRFGLVLFKFGYVRFNSFFFVLRRTR